MLTLVVLFNCLPSSLLSDQSLDVVPESFHWSVRVLLQPDFFNVLRTAAKKVDLFVLDLFVEACFQLGAPLLCTRRGHA